MKYFNEEIIKNVGENWNDIFTWIEKAITLNKQKDISQPIKPYLRYKDLTNRIIAMPSYVGGDINAAGIKWIASFPKNIEKNIPRANSVTILNNADTGEVKAIFNTAEMSIIRTAGVTGVVLKHFLKNKHKKFNILIIGFGPIGQKHYQMINACFKDKVNKIKIFDLKKIDYNFSDSNVDVVDNWQDAYLDSDIVITTTVSKDRYINIKPKDEALLLNVSLRDYKQEVYPYVKDGIIIDDWEEVNRENTDIELFSKNCGLKQKDTNDLYDIMQPNFFKDKVYMFNPMGMSIFDIAVAQLYYEKSLTDNFGIDL